MLKSLIDANASFANKKRPAVGRKGKKRKTIFNMLKGVQKRLLQ